MRPMITIPVKAFQDHIILNNLVYAVSIVACANSDSEARDMVMPSICEKE